MTVKKQVSYSDHIVIRETCRVYRRFINVITYLVLITVSGSYYKEHFGITDGCFKVPTKPGLGIEIHEELLAQYPFQDTQYICDFDEDGTVLDT